MKCKYVSFCLVLLWVLDQVKSYCIIKSFHYLLMKWYNWIHQMKVKNYYLIQLFQLIMTNRMCWVKFIQIYKHSNMFSHPLLFWLLNYLLLLKLLQSKDLQFYIQIIQLISIYKFYSNIHNYIHLNFNLLWQRMYCLINLQILNFKQQYRSLTHK